MTDFEIPKERQIDETEEYQTFVNQIDYLIHFFETFSNHIGDSRMFYFITGSKNHILDMRLIDSSVKTLKSIKFCCASGSFSDANTLIRKLRDDLILFAYLLNVCKLRNSFSEADFTNADMETRNDFVKTIGDLPRKNNLTDDELAVEAWFCNKISELPKPIKNKLKFENYMKVLRLNKHLNQVLEDYNLHNYWERLRQNLNDYVHTNGHMFTFQNMVTPYNKHLKVLFENINIKTSKIASFFVVLIIMIDSTLIGSADYVDHLDLGLEPPEDSQYFVAKYIQNFIDTKVTQLHPELKQYLKDNNNYGMHIE